MSYKKFEDIAVKRFKMALLEAGIGYKELSNRLAKIGIKESPNGIGSYAKLLLFVCDLA